MIALSFSLDKISGKGEDACPILERYPDGSGLLAVFDGMGGAGSTQYVLDDAAPVSGAWLASRLAKCTTAAFFRSANRNGGMAAWPETAELLGRLQQKVLRHALEGLDTAESGLRSRLIKRLPTTMAAIYFQSGPDASAPIQLCSIFAGDARAYVLRPRHGLQQISRDHLTQPADALDNLSGDSPLSNCINADTDFVLETASLEMHGPVLLITASDGCFGYVNFPAQFEFILLNTLAQSDSQVTWEERLRNTLGMIAADDVSLAVLALGWDDWGALQLDFAERKTFLLEHYVRPVAHAERSLHEAADDEKRLARNAERDALRKKLWNSYRVAYEHLIPGQMEEVK